mgnify:CR=1 FL=1
MAVDTAADPDGRMRALLLKWRQQRMRAIEIEVDRLKSLMQLPEGMAGVANWRRDGNLLAECNINISEWLA